MNILLVVSTFSASLTIALGTIYAAIEMHDVLLFNVLRWPLNIFDTTPQGRILNRFSGDVNIVDNIIPMLIRSLIVTSFTVNFFLYPILRSVARFRYYKNTICGNISR